MEMPIADALARERDGIERLFDTADAAGGPERVRRETQGGVQRCLSEVDFLIIGGGDAGFAAAQTLREEGAEGSVLIVSRDPDPPYDRTAVSKGFLGGEKSRARRRCSAARTGSPRTTSSCSRARAR